MKAVNNIGGFLSRIRQYARVTKSAMALSAYLLVYAPAFANSQTAAPAQFDPIREYCNQLEDPIKRSPSLDEVLRKSKISPEEQMFILLHYWGYGKEELEQICLENYASPNKK